MTHRCRTCRTVKAAGQFSRSELGKPTPKCRACVAEQDRLYAAGLRPERRIGKTPEESRLAKERRTLARQAVADAEALADRALDGIGQ